MAITTAPSTSMWERYGEIPQQYMITVWRSSSTVTPSSTRSIRTRSQQPWRLRFPVVCRRHRIACPGGLPDPPVPTQTKASQTIKPLIRFGGSTISTKLLILRFVTPIARWGSGTSASYAAPEHRCYQFNSDRKHPITVLDICSAYLDHH